MIRQMEKPNRMTPHSLCEIPRFNRRDLLFALALAALAAFSHAAIVFTGALPLDSDSLLFFYPLRSLHADPGAGLWDPYLFCGIPRDSNPQAQLLYWPNWFSAVLSTRWLFPMLLYGHSLLGGLSFYLLLRGLRCQPPSAFLGAASFLLGAYWRCKIANLGLLEGAAWVPALVYFDLLALSINSFTPLLAASLMLSMTILAGVPHTAIYALMLTGLIHLSYFSRSRAPRWRVAAMYVTLCAVSLMLCAGMLIPAWLNLPETVRTSLSLQDALGGSIEWKNLWKVFLGGLSQPEISRCDPWEGTCYMGVTALGFALLGWLRSPLRLRLSMSAAIALALAFTAGEQGGLYPLLYHWLPGWNSINLPNRSLLMAAIAAPLFAGLGFDAWLRGEPRRRTAIALGAGGGAALIAWLIAAVVNPSVRTTLIHSALSGAFSQGGLSDSAWAILNACFWGGVTLAAAAAHRAGKMKPALTIAVFGALIAGQSAQYAERLFLQTTPASIMQEPRTARLEKERLNEIGFHRILAFDPSIDNALDERARYTKPMLLPRLPDVYRVYAVQGYDPLFSKRYAELIRAWTPHHPSLDADRNIRFSDAPKPLLDLLGVRTLIGRPYLRTLYMGKSDVSAPGSLQTALRPAQPVKTLFLRWTAAGGESIPQGTQIGRVRIVSASKVVETFPIRMGFEIANQITRFGPYQAAHHAAPEYRWFPIPSRFGSLEARQYEVRYPVTVQAPVELVSVELTTPNIIVILYGVFAEPAASSDPYPLLTDSAEVPLYDNPGAFGPVYFSRNAVTYDRPASLVDTLSNWPSDQEPPVFFNEDDGPPPERSPVANPLGEPPTVQTKRPDSDHWLIQVDSQYDGVLAVSETWSPNWVATIDGEPASVLRANHAFMAIPVSAGEHDVVLTYFPKPFYFGGAVAGAALAAVLAWLVLYPYDWLIRKKEETA
ncbi:MAG: YfhO family protein [bacterium]|nr:YfhO family protein [bacterium]